MGGERRQPRYWSFKKGLNTKIHLAVDAHGMPIRVFITNGTTADYTQTSKQGINAEYVLADKGYESDEIRPAA
jgi:hypothetical protein